MPIQILVFLETIYLNQLQLLNNLKIFLKLFIIFMQHFTLCQYNLKSFQKLSLIHLL